MKKMYLYEPAMCCESGVCGVGVDAELLRVSTVINHLRKNGITVERYNLSSAPAEFIKNKTVNELIHKEGVDILPIAVVEDQMMKSGSYPTNEEFVSWLEISEELLENEKEKDSDDGCCCGGSCCE